MIKALIFDMDGVLVDSEKYWQEVEGDILHSLGVSADGSIWDKLLGLKLGDMFPVLKTHNASMTEKQMYDAFDAAADNVYAKCELLPGVLDCIDEALTQNLTLGVASSSSARWVGMVLDRFDIGKHFSAVFSSETSKLPGKPDPAVYLACMKALGVTPATTMVVEDSPRGVQAAMASGAFTIAVPDKRSNYLTDTFADLVVDSLEDPRVHQVIRGK